MKSIFLALVMALFALPALASKARLEALGQGATTYTVNGAGTITYFSGGSYYLKDDRNVFINPAHITRINESLLFEWGDNSNNVDLPASPVAEGGLYRKAFDGYLGLHLGSQDVETSFARNSAESTFLGPDNTLDLFYGQDGPVSWGVNLSYSKNVDETAALEKSENTVVLRGGAYLDNGVEFYAHLNAVDKAEGASANNDEINGKGVFTFGGAFNRNNWKYYAEFKSQKYEYSNNGGADSDIGLTGILLGAAHVFERDDQLFFYNLAINKVDTEEEPVEVSSLFLPITIGIEHKVKDWFALRGSVKQNVLLNQNDVDDGTNDYKDDSSNTTAVAAGSSVYFDEFRFDASFTTSGANITANNLFTRVSLNYTF